MTWAFQVGDILEKLKSVNQRMERQEQATTRLEKTVGGVVTAIGQLHADVVELAQASRESRAAVGDLMGMVADLAENVAIVNEKLTDIEAKMKAHDERFEKLERRAAQ